MPSSAFPDASANLGLPYILPSQAQKHVTHNEALRRLDALVQLSVVDRNRAEPPLEPIEGQRHIVGNAATGIWLGRDTSIASFLDGGWRFHEARPGWFAWCQEEKDLLVFADAAWASFAELVSASVTQLDDLEGLGVGATPDAINRFSLSSPASLFSHEGAGHQIKINKASPADTASVLMQSAYGGRGEIGLCSNDDLTFKVSADGASWCDAIRILGGSGRTIFPRTSLPERLLLNLFQDGGRFAGSPEAAGLSIGAFAAPNWLNAYNGAVFSAAGKFTNDNMTNGGAGAALPEQVASLIDRLKAPSARRYGPEFYLMRVVAGSGTASPRGSGGVTRYLPFTLRPSVLGPATTAGINILVESGSVAISLQAGIDMYIDGVAQASDQVIAAEHGWRQAVFVSFGEQAQSSGYSTAAFRIYAEPGASFLIGLPFLTPALQPPVEGELFGRVPSVQAWR